MALAEGRPEGVATLERMEVIEFYHFYKAWEARQEAIRKAYETP